MSPEQEAELNRFQQERVRIRKELRETRRSLDGEIEELGTSLNNELDKLIGSGASGQQAADQLEQSMEAIGAE